MTNPTSNFGWQMPTSTDLVTDLPADFETFGQAVDTSLADLKGGTSGQVLSKASNTDMDFTWVTSDDANAIQNAIVDAKGDLIAATAADTPARLAVGSNGQILIADSTAATGLSWQQNFVAGKNKFINGDLGIWQRGTSTSLTTGSAKFLADRWRCRCDFTAGTATLSQQTFTPGTAPVAGYEGSFFNRVSCGSTSTYSNFEQPIEDVRTFAGQTVTFSLWAKSSSAASLSFTAYQNFGSGGSSTVTVNGGTTYTTTTSWTRYSWTVSVPSVSGKTIGAISILDCYFEFSGTLGSVTCDTWGAQAEVSPVATAFQTASGSIGGELALCQRYFYRQSATANQTLGIASLPTQSIPVTFTNMPVTMRSAPTFAASAGNTFNAVYGANITAAANTVTADVLSSSTCAWYLGMSSNIFTTGGAARISAVSSSTYLEFSAEF
jgi:hypothetical protein